MNYCKIRRRTIEGFRFATYLPKGSSGGQKKAKMKKILGVENFQKKQNEIEREKKKNCVSIKISESNLVGLE